MSVSMKKENMVKRNPEELEKALREIRKISRIHVEKIKSLNKQIEELERELKKKNKLIIKYRKEVMKCRLS